MNDIPMLDENIKTYSHLIANRFGYEDNFLEEFSIKNKLIPKKAKIVENNKELRCFFCGNVAERGLVGKKLQKHVVPPTYNETYHVVKDTRKENQFVCSHCLYNMKNYQNMQNVVVFKDRVEKFIGSANEKNTFYDYIINGITEDCIILYKSRKENENMTYISLPTLADSQIFTVVYGMTILYIDIEELKNCLKDTHFIMDKYELNKEIDKGFITNIYILAGADKKSLKRNSNFLSETIIEDKELGKELNNYYLKYDRDVRIMTYRLYERYKLELLRKK